MSPGWLRKIATTPKLIYFSSNLGHTIKTHQGIWICSQIPVDMKSKIRFYFHFFIKTKTFKEISDLFLFKFKFHLEVGLSRFFDGEKKSIQFTRATGKWTPQIYFNQFLYYFYNAYRASTAVVKQVHIC